MRFQSFSRKRNINTLVAVTVTIGSPLDCNSGCDRMYFGGAIRCLNVLVCWWMSENQVKFYDWLPSTTVLFILNFVCPSYLLTNTVDFWIPINGFNVFTALHVMQTRYCEENSVCLSVRPSVRHTRVLWQNGRKICPDFYTVRKII